MYQNNFEIEFDEETHTYLINGKIVPSVTQLIHKKFPSLYASVPKAILQASAEFGDHVHKAIECESQNLEVPSLTIQEEICFKQYLKLKEEHNINPLENEKLVHFNDVYCGTLDMIADVNYTRSLIDVKTTTNLNREYLEWQLGLYLYALKSMGYEQKFGGFYALHIPKGKLGQLVPITPKNDKEIEQFLKEINLYE